MEEAVGSARSKGPIAALYIETPANPTNGMVDLERAREIVSGLHAPDGKRPVIVVDNTMLGPIYQTPLAHGADLVVTSLTKYVGGHSDLIAGGCLGAAASRTDPWHAHNPGHDVRSAYRLVADAFT